MNFNADIIKGQWNEVKGSFKQKWSKLTDNDIGAFEGNFDTLKGKLQQLYGFSKEKASSEVDEIVTRFNHAIHPAKDQALNHANDAVDTAKTKVDDANRKLNG